MKQQRRGLKADLHLHTCDGIIETFLNYNACTLIDRAAELGYEVLAVTNHNTLTYSAYLRDYACERGILLVPGIELTIRDKHVLAYNISREHALLSRFEDLLDLKDRNNLFIAPHPYFPAFKSLQELLPRWRSIFDAIEITQFYSPMINFNTKAIAAAARLGLPLVGSSDSHSLRQLNKTYSLIFCDKEIEAVVEAVKQGALEVVTDPLSLVEMGRIFYDAFVKNGFRRAIKKKTR